MASISVIQQKACEEQTKESILEWANKCISDMKEMGIRSKDFSCNPYPPELVESVLDCENIPCHHLVDFTISIGLSYSDLLNHERLR